MPRAQHIETVGLVAGLGIALQKLRVNAKDAIHHNVRVVAQEKVSAELSARACQSHR